MVVLKPVKEVTDTKTEGKQRGAIHQKEVSFNFLSPLQAVVRRRRDKDCSNSKINLLVVKSDLLF